MSRTDKDLPAWVRENRRPTPTRHRHWRHSCDDPEEFADADDLRASRMCLRASVAARFFFLKNSRFYERPVGLKAQLQVLARETSRGEGEEVDDSSIPVVAKNASLFRGGVYDW